MMIKVKDLKRVGTIVPIRYEGRIIGHQYISEMQKLRAYKGYTINYNFYSKRQSRGNIDWV